MTSTNKTNVKQAMVVDIRTWVKNVVNQPPTVTSNDIIVPLSTPTMCAKAVLICRPNSHPFQERTLSLEQPVKVGRSVARARASPTNAIFDCKVLSRHHALLWYKDGKFYLQVSTFLVLRNLFICIFIVVVVDQSKCHCY